MLTNDLDRLPPETRAALTGPGSPFELVRDDVRGVEMTVFAQRPPHLPALLQTVADQHADRPYLVFPDRALTYKETVDQVASLASTLHRGHGIGRGDRVAVVGPNSLDYALTLWALAWLGAVSVSLNGWWTGAELDHAVALASPKLLIGDERQLARTRAPSLPFTSLFGGPDSGSLPVSAELVEDDPVSILFTSGTTGRPKGAVITHRGLVNFAQDAQLRGYADALLSGATDPAPNPPVALVVSPFFHISGLGPLLGGGPYNGMTMVFPPRGRWDPVVHLELTERYGVTQWSGVPTQLVRLLRHPEIHRFDVSTVRTLGMGGAPITAELAVLFGAVLPGAKPAQGFGMSETCGQGTTIAGARMVENPQSIGLATPTSEVDVRDPGGSAVADGVVGEIYIRSPSGFLGYWNDPDATAAVLDRDGWYRTGDFGRVVDGMLQLESRLRDMIIRGGENVYPIEIENRLSEHPGILDAAVIGVPHDELGQEVMAVVVAPGLSGAAVQAWCAEALAAYKVPAQVRFVESLPYSATGKLLKRELEKLCG